MTERNRYTIQELAKDMIAAPPIDGDYVCEIAFTDDEGQKINIECAVTFVDGIPKAKQWSQIRWKPIDTAPKDGTTILVYTGPCCYVAKQNVIPVHWSGWGGGVWENSTSGGKLSADPTHWMPLPPEPKANVS